MPAMSQLTRLIGHGAQQQRKLASFLFIKTNIRLQLFAGSSSATAQAATRYRSLCQKSAPPTPTPAPAPAPAAAPVASSSSTSTSNKTDSINTSDLFGDASNMGLFVRFRHMYKQYWYVLIPVHCVTSMCWFGGFYYLSKVGVDVPALLQYVHLSENIIEKVQSSDMGHFAIAFLCFKVVTPLRYSVTLGGTTLSIKFLVKRGYIKPIPSKKQLIKMYEKKKATRRAKADKEEKDGSK